MIAIGSSTGGVESLLRVFKKLPEDLPPILITQHIPYGFSNSFAQRLNDNSQVDVCEAKRWYGTRKRTCLFSTYKYALNNRKIWK